MDVTCQRCATEYEFDETLVSDRGTTVKCTNCGHLFKVFRPGAGDRSWSIRKQDGTTLVLTSLRELQKLITKGELTEDDEISRSGEAWKPLGGIAELQTFFAAARAAMGGDSSAAATHKGSTLPFRTGPAATPFGPSPSAAPPPRHDPRAYAPTAEMDIAEHPPPAPSRGSRSGPLPAPPPAGPPRGSRSGPLPAPPPAGPPRSARGTVMGVGAGASSRPEPRFPPPAAVPAADGSPGHVQRATAPARAAPTRPEGPAAASGERPEGRGVAPTREAPGSVRPPAGGPAGGRPSERPSARPLYLDESEESLRPPVRRSRAGLWMTLVILIAAAGGVALAWGRIAPMVGLGGAEDPVAPFLERGDAALAEDHPEAYERALREYTRGTAFAERDPRLLWRMARAHALLAQALDFQADDLEARAAQDPTLAGEAAALRREQRRNAEEARRLAEDAVRQTPNDLDAIVALADALRLSGDAAAARSHLDRAASVEGEPSAERLRVEALLAVDEAGGDVAAAAEHAAAAVERDRNLVRARLVYARALLAQGNVAQARRQIDAVLSDRPQHPSARDLNEAIERGLPPAAPVVAVLDGGVADAGTAAEPAAEPARVATAGREQPAGGAGGGVPRGRDYSWYILNGDRALERNDVGRARALFEAALEARPGGSEALNGLGYVRMETGDTRGAVEWFRQAANQGYAPAYIGLGTAYRDMGQTRNAIEAYRSYLERMPDGPASRIARSQLELLGASATEESGGDSAGGGTGGDPTGDDTGGGTDAPEPAPPTAPDELPAPRGTDPDDPPPSSDPPAIGSE